MKTLGITCCVVFISVAITFFATGDIGGGFGYVCAAIWVLIAGNKSKQNENK